MITIALGKYLGRLSRRTGYINYGPLGFGDISSGLHSFLIFALLDAGFLAAT